MLPKMRTGPSSAGLTLMPILPPPASNVVTGALSPPASALYGGPSRSDGTTSVTHLPPAPDTPAASYAMDIDAGSSARGPTCAAVHTPTSTCLGPPSGPPPPPPPSSNLWTLLGSSTVNSRSIWQPWQLKALAPAKCTACPLTNARSTPSGRANAVVALYRNDHAYVLGSECRMAPSSSYLSSRSPPAAGGTTACEPSPEISRPATGSPPSAPTASTPTGLPPPPSPLTSGTALASPPPPPATSCSTSTLPSPCIATDTDGTLASGRGALTAASPPPPSCPCAGAAPHGAAAASRNATASAQSAASPPQPCAQSRPPGVIARS